MFELYYRDINDKDCYSEFEYFEQLNHFLKQNHLSFRDIKNFKNKSDLPMELSEFMEERKKIDKTNFQVGDIVTVRDLNLVPTILEEEFGKDVINQDGYTEYIEIIKCMSSFPLTIKYFRSYNEKHFPIFKEEDLAPDRWNYPMRIFQLYQEKESENNIKPIFGSLTFEE